VVDAFDWGLLEPAGAAALGAGDDAVLAAMVDTEAALVAAWDDLDGVASSVSFDSGALDRGRLVARARADGVPIVALVEQLREQAGTHADRVHRGATSQDIVDTALMLVSRDALAAARVRLTAAAGELAARASEARSTPLQARTLTQPAEPTTFGAMLAGWLDVVISAGQALDAVRYPVQLGGAVGTGAAVLRSGRSPDVLDALRASLAGRLALDDPGRAWHTDRAPALAVADAAAQVAAAGGRIGRDLALAARDGCLLPATGGASSAMPHKKNPVDAVLLTANGLRAPGLLATVHTVALSYDARPAGEWHAEWQAWRGLLRLASENAAVLAHAVPDATIVASAVPRPESMDAAALAAAEHAVDAALARFERTATL
jgi:3-carboxy-cis,cis-muconate cycloisomerase